MAKNNSTDGKERETREVLIANSAKLREIAGLIRECAEAYEIQAARMDENEIPTIELGGFPTIRDKVIKLARGNANTVAGTIQDILDARRMERICESPENFVQSVSAKKAQ